MKNKWSGLLGAVMLTGAAVIWGFAFVAQKQAMDYMKPLTCNCVRLFIGAFFLAVFLAVRDGSGHGGGRRVLLRHGRFPVPDLTKTELIAGLSCGVLLFGATTLQQFGVQDGDVGILSFITALYIVIVPVIGVFMHRRAGLHVWLGVGVALIGAYLLTIVGGGVSAAEISSVGDFFRFSRAYILVFLCAIIFSFHIVTVDRFSGRVDGTRLSMLQFLAAALISLPVMLLVERPTFGEILDGILPLLFLGVLSCGVAYTLQILGQARTEPAVASVIMSLESVFGAIGGALILGERMNPAELIGCALVFCAVIVAQIPPKKRVKGLSL